MPRKGNEVLDRIKNHPAIKDNKEFTDALTAMGQYIEIISEQNKEFRHILEGGEISKRIIMEELNDNLHPAPVEDVIFLALEYYSENKKPVDWGTTIAYAIKQRILDEEAEAESKVKVE